jgi:flagellar hook protein FlgE
VRNGFARISQALAQTMLHCGKGEVQCDAGGNFVNGAGLVVVADPFVCNRDGICQWNAKQLRQNPA